MRPIILPLSVYYGKTTQHKWRVNMNEYRRAHRQVLAKVKKAYAEQVQLILLADQELLRHLRAANFSTVRLTFTLYPFQKSDIENVCAIVSKFAIDALVGMVILPDDNMDVVRVVVYRAGKIDRENPRCELEIVHL